MGRHRWARTVVGIRRSVVDVEIRSRMIRITLLERKTTLVIVAAMDKHMQDRLHTKTRLTLHLLVPRNTIILLHHAYRVLRRRRLRPLRHQRYPQERLYPPCLRHRRSLLHRPPHPTFARLTRSPRISTLNCSRSKTNVPRSSRITCSVQSAPRCVLSGVIFVTQNSTTRQQPLDEAPRNERWKSQRKPQMHTVSKKTVRTNYNA